MKKSIFLFCLVLIIQSCGLLKKQTVEEQLLPEASVTPQAEPPVQQIYRASNSRHHDLLHVKLNVSFNWEETYLNGEAWLKLKPYFYPVTTLVLDAKGFDLHEISLLSVTGEKKPLEFEYDSMKIKIELGREYTNKEEYEVYIKYTAKPNELKVGGSAAITEDKGLYFINPDGTEQYKPKQIWTQGETEANSCWYPTIDSPNERMTQELYITVDESYLTLSNGVLMYATDNGDGTRTDYWKQNLPHAPYLTMMAIGEFAVINDSWRDKEVNYYVEAEYEPYAKMIFGNTPEMLEFYSEILGVDYVWDKYSQIVVRDYVSGAMENTTAVIHGEFVQVNERKFEDKTNEDIIAHELFHHWFGDLVTCESWSNIPLNESFATYGEYLWMEYKYGQDAADHHLQKDMQAYLSESKEKMVDLIRFDYNDKEDMFDRHSYQKGGRVLHMLRKYVGDEAFFNSLQLYLTNNKFKSVEIHNLRLAFEEVTGEDLNWFFNQWFLSSGHPRLSIEYYYSDSLSTQTVVINQIQDFETTGLFKLPLQIDIYSEGSAERHNVIVSEARNEYTFPVNAEPDLVNVDAEKMLLAEKVEYKTMKQYVFQYYNAPLYVDKYESVFMLGNYGTDSLHGQVIIDALNDKFWYIRNLAMNYLSYYMTDKNTESIKNKLSDLAKNDEKSDVRSSAIQTLNDLFPADNSLSPIYEKCFNDKSYKVSAEALYAIAKSDSLKALHYAEQLEKEDDPNTYSAISLIYADYGTEQHLDFFVNAFNKIGKYELAYLLSDFGSFLSNNLTLVTDETLSLLEYPTRNNNTWWIRLNGFFAIKDIQKSVGDYISTLNENLENVDKEDTVALDSLNTKINLGNQQNENLTAIIDSIKSSEKDQKVLNYYEYYQ